jgi:hypothetical protein
LKYNLSIILFIVFMTLSACRNQITITGLDSLIAAAAPTSVMVCPTGYIAIPVNTSLDVDQFCIMKYEAKAWQDDNGDSLITTDELDETSWEILTPAFLSTNWNRTNSLTTTHIPVSVLDNRPWDLSANESWAACDGLNSEVLRAEIDNDLSQDGSFALTSNPEWMAIARNIEDQPENWTSGSVGVDCLKQGNINVANNCTSGPSSFNGPNMGASTIATSLQSSSNPLASHILSNGEVIWDFSGGLSEWVDWQRTSSLTVIGAFTAAGEGPGAGTFGTYQFKNLNLNIAVEDIMFLDSWSPMDNNLAAVNGIGRYLHQQQVNFLFGDSAASRGGDFTSATSEAGIYNLKLKFNADATTDAGYNVLSGHTWSDPLDVGFRCVWRP